MAKTWFLREPSPTTKKLLWPTCIGDWLVDSHAQASLVHYLEMHFCAQGCAPLGHLMSSAWISWSVQQVHKNGNAWTPEVHKTTGSAQDMHKFVHSPFTELGHPLYTRNAHVQVLETRLGNAHFCCCVSMWAGMHIHVVEGRNLGKN